MKKVDIYEVHFAAFCKIEDSNEAYKSGFIDFIIGNTDVLKKISQGYTDNVSIIEDSIKLNLYRKDVYFDENADKKNLSSFRIVQYHQDNEFTYPDKVKTLCYIITNGDKYNEFIRSNEELEKLMEYDLDSNEWAVIEQDICEIKI